MARKAAERLVWAVETLAVGPDDRLLEIGCGQGVAVSLVCERLDGGRITAIDRSETMIAMAGRRNRAHVASGKAVLRVAALPGADFGGERFDKVFAIRVGIFWQQPATALGSVRQLLTPGGTVFLFHESPAWQTESATRAFTDRATGILRDQDFSVTAALCKDLRPGQIACLVARAP